MQLAIDSCFLSGCLSNQKLNARHLHYNKKAQLSDAYIAWFLFSSYLAVFLCELIFFVLLHFESSLSLLCIHSRFWPFGHHHPDRRLRTRRDPDIRPFHCHWLKLPYRPRRNLNATESQRVLVCFLSPCYCLLYYCPYFPYPSFFSLCLPSSSSDPAHWALLRGLSVCVCVCVCVCLGPIQT